MYIVYPIENSDKTEEFMRRTDSTFKVWKTSSINLALYSLLLIGESIIKREAEGKSTPMRSLITYSHKDSIS